MEAGEGVGQGEVLAQRELQVFVWTVLQGGVPLLSELMRSSQESGVLELKLSH